MRRWRHASQLLGDDIVVCCHRNNVRQCRETARKSALNIHNISMFHVIEDSVCRALFVLTCQYVLLCLCYFIAFLDCLSYLHCMLFYNMCSLAYKDVLCLCYFMTCLDDIAKIHVLFVNLNISRLLVMMYGVLVLFYSMYSLIVLSV